MAQYAVTTTFDRDKLSAGANIVPFFVKQPARVPELLEQNSKLILDVLREGIKELLGRVGTIASSRINKLATQSRIG